MQESTAITRQRPEHGRGAASSSQDPAIRVRGLAKLYRNPWTLKITRGVEDLDFEVQRGEVMGYLGPNGAGKTTTLKLLAGLIKPTHGSAWLMGVPIEETRSRRQLGFLPEQPYFYDYLSGLEYLEMAGGLCGLGGHEAHQRATHWLGRVGLGDRPRLLLRKYSKGMLQRLGLAAALVHEPEVLILDEPMSGLDPFGRRDVRELILEQRERGTTVLFSSHIIPDVEMLCDRAAIVLQGKLVRVATVAELVQGGSQQVVITCAGRGVFEMPASWQGRVTRRDRGAELDLEVHDHAHLQSVLADVVRAGLEVRAVTPHRSSLEELFMSTARGMAPAESDPQRRTA